jgi:hypothetical protein
MIMSSGLSVLPVHHPPRGPSVKIQHEAQDYPDPPDKDQRTSFRFFGDQGRTLTPGPHLDPRPYYAPRDRDLGQTLTTPPGLPFRLTAITLRVGPALKAVGRGAPGQAVSVQFFSVSGTPEIFDVHGNPIINDHDPGRDTKADYITGENYEPLWVVSGGRLPEPLVKDQWLRWQFPGDALVLQPGQHYAFLVMFDDPAPEQELALANQLHGPTTAFGGHGIRREGSVAQPWRDPSWVNNNQASALPQDRAARLAQPPGTWGRPDVDTYRVLTLFIEGSLV